MTLRMFLIVLGAILLIALVVYLVSTPHGKEIPLVGVVDGNQVIVSPQISGRMIRLFVDEGSEVKQGQLIAELDPAELQAQLDSQEANIRSLEAKVAQARRTLVWTDDQTGAALHQAEANVTAMRAQLEAARATAWRDEVNYKRAQALFESGVLAAQDRDAAKAAFDASEANVKSLEEQVKAQAAALAMANANRKQLDVLKSELASTQSQLQQARAIKAQVETQLGYTKIYAPLSGVVSVRVAKQGEVVAQSGPIVVIVDVNHLWVRADVEETYIDSIEFGQHLKVQLPSGDLLDGTVFFKGVEGDFATQRDVSRTKRDIKAFAIKVSVPNPERRLFTGMTATVLLPPPAPKRRWLGKGFASDRRSAGASPSPARVEESLR